ncbi:hypothetical protein ACFPTX_19585 [Pseudomonas sp. GCM10022188]|uniref:hypothetical protein n=1 Tax=Pseudomonas TaxID=286 RepID=UPI001E31BEDB|nr:hypothetical protein [Pseudomonas oryzagri]MCC6073916.1 hypothetical protein [Pseudomonas oryzagri]
MNPGIILAVLLLLVSSAARADSSVAQQLHEIRTHGFMLCSNLLVYFNSQDPASAFDPKVREEYRLNLRDLDTLAGGVADQPGIADSLQELKATIDSIEKEPEDVRVLYTSSLMPILRAHGDLEKAAESAYLKMGATSPVVAGLNQLSLDMGRMLLLYESQAFINIGEYSVKSGEGSFEAIDQRIGSRFEELLKLEPNMESELREAITDYRFVRQKLKASNQTLISRSAIMYLGRSVEKLNLLAKNVERKKAP